MFHQYCDTMVQSSIKVRLRISMTFELTNEQRYYLGLDPVKDHWDIMQLSASSFVYFDQSIIRKLIEVDETTYYEYQLDAVADDSRTYLLPRTSRGKKKRLSVASVASSPRRGVYFSYDHRGASIANYTTQATYFSCVGDGKLYRGFDDLKNWLAFWIADSTEYDLNDLAKFKCATRKHHDYQEGDFFAFKIGRREYGFGRILMNIDALRRSSDFAKEKYSRLHFMGKPLFVKVYHYMSSSPFTDINELRLLSSFPSQPIMDNSFYYGEYRIIGNLKLTPDELEFPIYFDRSLNVQEPRTIFLQYGQIFCETDIATYNSKLHTADNQDDQLSLDNSFRDPLAGFRINGLYDIDNMKQCIAEKSNHTMWTRRKFAGILKDIRNPIYSKEKLALFDFFGLDEKTNYYENMLRLAANTSTLPTVLRYVVDPCHYAS